MMHADPDQLARTAAIDFTRCAVAHWQTALGSELLGAYLIGSLAHGGFSRRYSDIDIALVTEAELPSHALDRMRGEAVALSEHWGPKLSLFWTDRHFCLGRFPPLDRIDYIDHAVTLMERECVRPMRPAIQEIQRYLAGAPFANWREMSWRFATAASLEAKERKAYLRTLLYPARFCYSLMTGHIASNDDAVAFLVKKGLAQVDVSLITRALQCRQTGADPDYLFPARTRLPSQVDACAALLAELVFN